MSVAFYIHHLGEQLGPWSKEQVVEKINIKEVNITDYVFDDEFNEWVLICESPHFSECFKNTNSSSEHFKLNHQNQSMDHQEKTKTLGETPVGAVHEFVDPQSADQAWYILKNENKFGPYSYLNLVKMLQSKQLMEYDFIFKDGMDSWKTVSEVEDFSTDKIRQLKNSGEAEINELFFRRRYLRVEYGASIIIHNNKSVWKGKSLEISPGGAGFLLEKIKISEEVNSTENQKTSDDHTKSAPNSSAAISIGQNLFLHYKAGDGVPPFNAVCTVVSLTPVEDHNFKLGVKFTNISQNIQQSIKAMTDSFTQKSAA